VIIDFDWLWSILIFSFLFTFIAIRIYFRVVYTSIISWPIEIVDKIDNQLKILWVSTFISKLNLSIDNYRQISSTIDLSTYRLRFRWSTLIDMLRSAWCETSRIPCASQKRNCKIMGVVNHILNRRGSQFYAFNKQIFTRQFPWQKFIEISQIFTKLWCCVPNGTRRE